MPVSVAACSFSRKESADYFSNNHHRRNGVAYLISRSFYSNQVAADKLPPDDLQMCLKLALFVKTLTEQQAKDLGEFLNVMLKRVDQIEEYWEKRVDDLETVLCESSTYCPNCRCSKCQSRQSCRAFMSPHVLERVRMPPLPRDYPSIRQKIIRGDSAFMTLLPTPKIHDLDEHVYVLPSDCIKHFLAHGNQPMDFNIDECEYPVTSFNQSPRGVALCNQLSVVMAGIPRSAQKPHFQISFLEWKDDCESAKSNKASKNSLWLFTITIFLKDRQRDSRVGTFAVAIGPKGKSHESVERVIGEDIARMRHNALPAILGWNKNTKAVSCTFTADLYMSLGDQPERRGGNVLQLGSSTHHPRWRHALAYGNVIDKIPACSQCYQVMISCDTWDARNNLAFNTNCWTDLKCTVCTNWGADFSNDLLRFNRPKSFPKTHQLGGEIGQGQLSPIVLTHEVLKKVLDLTFEMVSTGKWTAGQGRAYITTNCINQRFAKVAVARALNVLNLETAKTEFQEDEARYRRLLHDQEKHPHKYKQVPTPALYERGVPLRAFVDTPMHLLLLGVCRTVFRRITTWATRLGRRGAFVEYGQKLLIQLDNLKLSWLTFVPKTFSTLGWGGWVSKNYGSLLRVALWVYGPLLTIPDEPPYVDPENHPKEWLVTTLREWLRVRGLETSGKKKDLFDRVNSYFAGDRIDIPPVLPVQVSTKEQMWDMLKSMLLLITTLFQEKVHKNTKLIIDLRVRIFLSNFEEFEKPMRKPNIFSWLASYNFLCLLNLPETVDEFGPCRLWFEGKWQGERFVSDVKQERTRCPPKNVLHYLMRNLHCSKAIAEIVRQNGPTIKDELLALNTRVYNSEQEVNDTFKSRDPMPIVVLEDGSYAALIYERGKSVGKRVLAKSISRSEIEGEDGFHHGLKYWRFQLEIETKLVDRSCISDFGVLLQKIGCEELGVYTIVTKNWATTMFGEYDFAVETMERPTREETVKAFTLLATGDWY
jgi:hypothetical protein